MLPYCLSSSQENSTPGPLAHSPRDPDWVRKLMAGLQNLYFIKTSLTILILSQIWELIHSQDSAAIAFLLVFLTLLCPLTRSSLFCCLRHFLSCKYDHIASHIKILQWMLFTYPYTILLNLSITNKAFLDLKPPYLSPLFPHHSHSYIWCVIGRSKYRNHVISGLGLVKLVGTVPDIENSLIYDWTHYITENNVYDHNFYIIWK